MAETWKCLSDHRSLHICFYSVYIFLNCFWALTYICLSICIYYNALVFIVATRCLGVKSSKVIFCPLRMGLEIGFD